MALSLNAADSCKFLSVIINYTASSSTVLTLEIEDISGNTIAVPVTFTIDPGSGPISYPIPITNLSITNGLVTVKLKTDTGNVVEDGEKSVLLHCDIDCCLTKLTNELIDCHCDCARCSIALAKAQKVFLLIDSADYAIVQANSATTSAKPGFLQDANSKYLKAKEVCDDSCGCNC